MNPLGWIWNLLRTPEERSAEGEPRAGPWLTMGGWLPETFGESWNYWQRGYDPIPSPTTSAVVESCVSAYAQTIAMLPGDHWITLANGGRQRVTTSALSRLLRRPNSYQTPSDFLMKLVRDLYLEGNAYVLANMNNRQEPTELHLMDPRASSPRIAPATGDIFYALGGNPIVEAMLQIPRNSLVVPARFVMHIRLHPSTNPLLGETPLGAAALDLAAQHAMTRQQISFFKNQARPSTVLTTDLTLSSEQVVQLRTLWDQQTKGLAAGGTPILTGGLKPHRLSATAADAQLVEMMKLSEEHIPLVFRVPSPILGRASQQPFASTEVLMAQWIASGLGFALNHIEVAIDRLFGLKGYPDEYTEFDTSALMRSAFKDRIEGLARAVQGGILAPNEARRLEGYPDAEAGDEPRVQQQVVPLTAWEKISAAPPAPAAEPNDEEEGDEQAREFRTFLADARRDVALLGP
jgi:HK97 family phage portal protein